MASIHHIHIKSVDPYRSAAWWADMFGARVLPAFEIGPTLFVPVDLDGVRINFTRPGPDAAEGTAPPPPAPHYGLEHLGLLIDDLDATLAEFEGQGLTVYDRRQIEGFKIAFASSPDGVVLELLEPRA
jgi:catechol 2,3-dioxygenase-like lactoylglutathione lyase family enzyme